MTKKKIAIAIAAAALAGTCAIGGTLAWLTSTTGNVTNVFTFGEVGITLDETNVDGKDSNGNPNSDTSRDTYNTYHIVPGNPVDKDPQVHVEKGSEPSYVFVRVDNQFGANAQLNINNEQWASVEGYTDLYVYTGTGADNNNIVTVEAGEGYVDLDKVFTTVTFSYTGENDKTDYEGKNIIVTAYAVQANYLTDDNTPTANYAEAVKMAATALSATESN